MTISIRLDKSTEESLRRRLQAENVSLSDFVREAIREKLAKEDRPSPYELGKHLFGLHGSGRSDLSQNRKAILKEKLLEKHRRR